MTPNPMIFSTGKSINSGTGTAELEYQNMLQIKLSQIEVSSPNPNSHKFDNKSMREERNLFVKQINSLENINKS